MHSLTQDPTHYFRLELSNDDEWYNLYAIVPSCTNLSPRAKFAAEMGKDAALIASRAIAQAFGYLLIDGTES